VADCSGEGDRCRLGLVVSSSHVALEHPARRNRTAWGRWRQARRAGILVDIDDLRAQEPRGGGILGVESPWAKAMLRNFERSPLRGSAVFPQG
jgi:hypothetical protein